MWLLDGVSHLFQSVTWLLFPPWTSTVSKDIIQLIHEDHGRVRTLYAQYQSPANTMQQRQLLALDIIRHSSMHSKKEDMVLGPALASCTSCGDAAVLVAQHQHLEELMELLLSTPVTDSSFDKLLARFMEDTEQHLQAEERELLPHMEQALSHEQLMRLGRAFEWAKLIAPSRPHSWAPKAPALSHIVNALLTPLDFILDLVAFGGAPTL